MNHSDYSSFYLDTLLGTLGGNRTHFSITDPSGVKEALSREQRRGLMVLVLVSLIEANFLSKEQLRELRNFKQPMSIPNSVNLLHLSCYIYIRDCFAHNPARTLLPAGRNTNAFLQAVADGAFPYAKIQNNNIFDINTHELHLIVLRFFGQSIPPSHPISPHNLQGSIDN